MRVLLVIVATVASMTGCVGTVSTYTSQAERDEFDRTCAAIDDEHMKAAERASAVVAIVASTTRLECSRPRLWIKVDGPTTPTADARAEMAALNRSLIEQGQRPVVPEGSAGPMQRPPAKEIRLGGAVLREIEAPRIAYPADARRAGLEGVVVVSYVIGTDGSVSGAEIVQSAHPVLDQLVLDGIARVRYAPRTEPDAKPLRVRRPAEFSLKK